MTACLASSTEAVAQHPNPLSSPPPHCDPRRWTTLSQSCLFVERSMVRTLLTTPSCRAKNKRHDLPSYVTVYKVPTRTTLAGYKAQEWGDLAEPLWKGRMRIIETSKICAIRLEDANSGSSSTLTSFMLLSTRIGVISRNVPNESFTSSRRP